MMWVALMVAVALVAVFAVFDQFLSSSARQSRALRRHNERVAVFRQKQLTAATTALTRIAANDSGNPTLDAQIALEEINRLTINELENK